MILLLFIFYWIHRLLAREGINADQLSRDLKSFELKVSILSIAYVAMCSGRFSLEQCIVWPHTVVILLKLCSTEWPLPIFLFGLLKDDIWGCIPGRGNKCWRIPATGFLYLNALWKFPVLDYTTDRSIYITLISRFMKWQWYRLYRRLKKIMFEALTTTCWKCWRSVFRLSQIVLIHVSFICHTFAFIQCSPDSNSFF